MSARQRQIVGLVALGKTNRQIASELGLGEGSVKEYLNRIYQKLECRNRTELALRVYDIGDSRHGNQLQL